MFGWIDAAPSHLRQEQLLNELFGTEVPGGLNASNPSLTTNKLRHPTPGAGGPSVLNASNLSNQTDADGKDHIATKWEGLPLTGEAGNIEADDGAGILADGKDEDKPKTYKEKLDKVFKVLLPHCILIGMLLCYLCIGAFLLIRLETNTELELRRDKLSRLNHSYASVNTHSYQWIQDHPGATQEDWHEQLSRYLDEISEIHEGRSIKHDLEAVDEVSSKWTFPTALLYALTVLTTCGYGEVNVLTSVGQIFAVSFALMGIPLMFITAADIGKFLSETLLDLMVKFDLFWKRVKNSCLWYPCRRLRKLRSKSSTRENLSGDPEGGGGVDDELASPDTPSTDQFEGKLWFPIFAYVSLISLYCSMGTLMFRHWEPQWSFVHAFHFGFNLIVTVGLGDVVVTDPIFLCLLVAFVIVGLSVVTMCVDLASTHLKAYFTRIHYFGRARKLFGMSEDLREIVGLLAAMRKKKGGKVTWDDVKNFLDSELARAYEPHDLLKKMRWIDETSSGMSTGRHGSCSSDVLHSGEHSPAPPPSLPPSSTSNSTSNNNNNFRRTPSAKSAHGTGDLSEMAYL